MVITCFILNFHLTHLFIDFSAVHHLCTACKHEAAHSHRELQVDQSQQYRSSQASHCQDHYSHIDDNQVSVFYYFKVITFTFFIG